MKKRRFLCWCLIYYSLGTACDERRIASSTRKTLDRLKSVKGQCAYEVTNSNSSGMELKFTVLPPSLSENICRRFSRLTLKEGSEQRIIGNFTYFSTSPHVTIFADDVLGQCVRFKVEYRTVGKFDLLIISLTRTCVFMLMYLLYLY